MTDGDADGDGGSGNASGRSAEGEASDSEPLRLWLVERDYDDKGLVTLVYATPDGTRRRRTEWAAASLGRRAVTAAIEADPDDLESTPAEDVERYRGEVERMRERHDPDEEV